MKDQKLIYRFPEGNATMKDLLGSKGANLCELSSLGLQVPPGFIITTDACRQYYSGDAHLPEGLWEAVRDNITNLEKATGRIFGSPKNPLLISVRSGASISMPGMMDTILNLGINKKIADGLGILMKDQRPALDAHRRFLQMFSKVVLGMDGEALETALADQKKQAGVRLDHELDPQRLQQVIANFETIIFQSLGLKITEDPWTQLKQAIESVFRSWHNPRAMYYREYHGIAHNLGTAVTVMAMVFGNLGDDSGTGVLFTRNPSNGERRLYGEYLANAQGEDVVAGIRTPEPILQLSNHWPVLYEELAAIAERLENHYKDVQDVEFTIERGKLYILQTRTAKRTPLASVKTAVDMTQEGLLTRKEAILRVVPEEVVHLLAPRFDPEAKKAAIIQGSLLAQGIGAAPGAATGRAIFDASRAVQAAQKGQTVILVRPETSPDDVHGILSAVGVLTSRGGITSHAAVVTRGLGKACIVGCEELHIDLVSRTLETNGVRIQEGASISIDGTTGEVFGSTVDTLEPDIQEQEDLHLLLSWADSHRVLEVWANADTVSDATRAIAFGAQGIGLCRTEHMFLGPERAPVVRKLLMHAGAAQRWQEKEEQGNEPNAGIPIDVENFLEALRRLEEFQKRDFLDILRVMGKRPTIIRLLDPPLHEFLLSREEYKELLMQLGEQRNKVDRSPETLANERILQIFEGLQEVNPMMGHRGCRLGITFPAIYDMQVRAIMMAACELTKQGLEVHPEIMIPLVSHVNELRQLKPRLTQIAEQVQEQTRQKVPYLFGTMIELARAALTAGSIAAETDFFSFGTNDLTQTTFGFSRDDAESKFLQDYLVRDILSVNPFATLDQEGVGRLIRMAVIEGRQTRPGLSIGICGEHGGDPRSISFCHSVGLDYVSCSPYRVPVARLAAAQAAIMETCQYA